MSRNTAVDRAAAASHDIWQMDASEKVPLTTEQRISWLRLVDEFSGAVLQTLVFPPRALAGRQAAVGLDRERILALDVARDHRRCSQRKTL